MSQILSVLTDKDLQMLGLKCCLSRNDADMAMSLSIVLPELPTVKVMFKRKPIVMFPAFGLITSNARKLKLTFYSGYSDPNGECSFVHKRWFASKRHTSRFSSEKEIKTAIDIALESYPAAIKTIQEFDTTLPTRQVDSLLIESGTRGILPWGRIKHVAGMINEVISSKGKRLTKAWDLMIQFSRIIPMNRPINQMDQLYEFGQMVLGIIRGRNKDGMGRPAVDKKVKQGLPKEN